MTTLKSTVRCLAGALAVAAGLSFTPAASAHGPYGPGYWYGPRVGVYIGPGPYYWGPRYWGPPAVVYAPPPAVYGPVYGPVYAPASPPVYIEKDSEPSAPPQAATRQWLYLCNEPRGVYPDVRQCPGGWERVPAVPPGQVR